MSSLEDKVMALFGAIKHGNKEHQDWLFNKIKEHFEGYVQIKPESNVPQPICRDNIQSEV